MNTNLREQLFENMDDLEIIMAQGGPIPDAHIEDGDHLLVDVKRKAEHENIVAIEIDDEIYIKRLMIQDNKIDLIPHNEADNLPPFNTLEDLNIYGVITWVIKKMV
jgi:DNA polymerase V